MSNQVISVQEQTIALIDALPLPPHRYIPTKTSRHDWTYLEAIKSMSPDTTLSTYAESNITWWYGVKLYDQCFYWEAHEVWETVWLNTLPNSLERHFLQCWIQLANACLKLRMHKHKAVMRLIRIAINHWQRAVYQPSKTGGKFAPEPNIMMGLCINNLSICFTELSQCGIQDSMTILHEIKIMHYISDK